MAKATNDLATCKPSRKRKVKGTNYDDTAHSTYCIHPRASKIVNRSEQGEGTVYLFVMDPIPEGSSKLSDSAVC